ncbi:hypothetical protein D9757_011866 [Collybiopsis confluens]|uniref:Uncharacterized protein n=1 Tax=Collybiopsis confluens TaxID=2823264 RepID=A0A8H5D3M9_9AGAR|nr:hypothetical protein D9757_011866 [Collybiopsis confluens]
MLILMFSAHLISTVFTVMHAVSFVSKAWNLLTITIKAEFGAVLIAANLSVLTPYLYRYINPEGDFDSKPCTYYRSFQSDGGFRLRRVAEIAPEICIPNLPHMTSIRTVQVRPDIQLGPEVTTSDLEPSIAEHLAENNEEEKYQT